MNRYQFYISYNEKPNTASSKAIDDCTRILAQQGYKNYNLSFKASKGFKISVILLQILKLIVNIKIGSIVAVQYPLLSGNKVFKHIMSLLRLKKVKFFCIVHDLDALRFGSDNPSEEASEIQLLNCYHAIIVHNDKMKNWLSSKGVKVPMVSLNMFDYLTDTPPNQTNSSSILDLYTVVFAGNLSKSKFIYRLGDLKNWHFNVYGPNYEESNGKPIANLCWMGSFPPDKIISNMNGSFGLVWDGEQIDSLDHQLGNYLKFNNPHKFSLYLAAGLPVIAPKESAIASIIEQYNIGLLIENLTELKDLKISSQQLLLYRKNVLLLTNMVSKGYHLLSSIATVEGKLRKSKDHR
jgi:hypothetical protein